MIPPPYYEHHHQPPLTPHIQISIIVLHDITKRRAGQTGKIQTIPHRQRLPRKPAIIRRRVILGRTLRAGTTVGLRLVRPTRRHQGTVQRVRRPQRESALIGQWQKRHARLALQVGLQGPPGLGFQLDPHKPEEKLGTIPQERHQMGKDRYH